MHHYLAMSIIAAILAPAVALGARSPASAPSPTAGAATAQTKAPASPTSASPQAAASPATGGPSLADLMAKARTATEYSFDHRATSPGQTSVGKTYIKGTKVWDESSIGGQNT